MNGGTLGFHVVPYEYRAFPHHLEVCPFPSDFILSSVPGQFLRADEELGRSREVVDLFKNNVVKFNYGAFQVQDDVAYPLGLDEPPNAIDFCIFPFS